MSAVAATARPGATAIFAANILLSAGLLFMIQPLVGKALLPPFGGGAAVWTAVMLFFQAALLAGSLLFHLTTTRLGPRHAAVVHVGLAVIGAALLPILPTPRLSGGGAAFDVLFTLAIAYGPAMLAMGANAAALQAWYAAAVGRPPWWLYAVSNGGSLVGLLAYPLLVEPVMALSAQGRLWAWGFALSAAGLAIAALLGTRDVAGIRRADRAGAPAIPWRRRLAWVGLAALPSSLMLGATEYITVSIAPLPLLWVLPLAVYLLSWIFAFWRPEGARRAGAALFAGTGLLAMLDMVVPAYGHDYPAVAVLVHLLALLGAATMAHGTLATLRPAPAQLTGFYLAISAGGVAGGICNALIAPAVLDRPFEYPLALALGCLVIGTVAPVLRNAARLAGVGIVMLPLLAQWDRTRILAFDRDFYGALRVEQGDDRRVLAHGRTMHGFQWRDPARALEPSAYYHREAGGGRLIAALIAARGGTAPLSGYVIGLGAGTMACYQSADLRLAFAEISPAVHAAARRSFTFLSGCGDPVVEIGDGRLLLLARAPASLDLIVVDAYSGGSVPVHLGTTEALGAFLDRLRPGGAIAIHASNERFDLAPFMAAGGIAQGAHVLRFAAHPEGHPSLWLAMTRDAAFAARLEAEGWTRQAPAARPWRDDQWDLLSALRGR